MQRVVGVIKEVTSRIRGEQTFTHLYSHYAYIGQDCSTSGCRLLYFETDSR